MTQDARPPLRQPPGDAIKAAAAELQFTDIAPDDPRLAADILPVLRELRPHLTAESLTSIYAEGHPLLPGAEDADEGVIEGADVVARQSPAS